MERVLYQERDPYRQDRAEGSNREHSVLLDARGEGLTRRRSIHQALGIGQTLVLAISLTFRNGGDHLLAISTICAFAEPSYLGKLGVGRERAHLRELNTAAEFTLRSLEPLGQDIGHEGLLSPTRPASAAE